MTIRRSPRLGALLAAGAVLLLSGCGRNASSLLGPNQAPEIEIVDARADRGGAAGVHVRWAARDPDGRVRQSRWSLTPWSASAVSATRVVTTAEECLLPRASAIAAGAPGMRAPERFSVWAVDNAGIESQPASLAIFANNVAPFVWITGPYPSALLPAQVAPEVCITWDGNDPDGIFTTKPVKYKYILLTENTEFPMSTALQNPDSLRRYYAPLNWAGWDSTSSDTQFVRFSNLNLNQSYLFVVTGFDEVGDYDPIFSLNKNMLFMQVVYPDTHGPLFRVWGAGFSHYYPSGGWSDQPERVIHTEVAADAPVTIDWDATPVSGQNIRAYRWVLDPVDLHDETPRADEQTDVRHWSHKSRLITSATLGPFSPTGPKRESHTLYIEAESTPGGCAVDVQFKSLAIVQLVVVRPTHQRELLIVDDTRLQVDNIGPSGCPANYTQRWPSAAELDTFLYARGGVPWRCTVNPTSGVMTTGGLFAGYDFDTLGTRGRLSGPRRDNGIGQLFQDQCVPLSVLANYRHVVWITDGLGALYTNPIDNAFNPMTGMTFTSQPGMTNVLSSYVRMGGKLWLAGATATASLRPWDRLQNNGGGLTRFSSAPALDEIGPGRLMWDSAKLRSEITVANSIQASRALGRFEPTPGAYDALPLALQSRNSGTDPLPPTRIASQGGNFYVSVRQSEFLTQPNIILEDADGDPGTFDDQSVLDSLYVVQGSGVPIGTGNVAMTRYHGAEHGEVVWSGFEIWSFQRAQCIQLVDAVMQGIWGLPRAPVARGAASAPVAMPGGSRPASLAQRWRNAVATKR